MKESQQTAVAAAWCPRKCYYTVIDYIILLAYCVIVGTIMNPSSKYWFPIGISPPFRQVMFEAGHGGRGKPPHLCYRLEFPLHEYQSLEGV